jgi:DNA primase
MRCRDVRHVADFGSLQATDESSLGAERKSATPANALIGQETIERVRQQASLVAVVEDSVRLQRRGRSLIGLCPFHKEKTPSFHVNPERGFYHCFGCGVSGDAIRFVQETEGVSFVDAVRQLAERFSVTIVEVGNDTERRMQHELRRRQQELYEVSNAAAAFFEQMLREHPLQGIAQDELRRRGLVPSSPTDPVAHALQAFRIGYAPVGWDELAKHLRGLDMSHAAAESVGLIIPRKNRPGHYDRFRHRLMFAVMDTQGRVIAFSGRILPAPEPQQLKQLGLPAPSESSAQESPAKYLNSPESPIYRKREALFGWFQARNSIRDAGQAVVVEGNFDVVSLHARGIENIVAPLGTAFTLEQAQLVRRLAPEVCLLFDGDKAGRRAVRASRDAIRESGLGCKVASLPDGLDPDELVRRLGPAAIAQTIRAGKGLLEYLIDSVLDSGFAADDAIAQAARIKEVIDLLAAETDPSVRALATRYADQIAARLGIADSQTFSALVRRVKTALTHPVGQSRHTSANGEPDPYRPNAQSDRIGMEILGALLDHPQLLDSPELSESAGFLEGDIAAAVAAARTAMTGHPVLATEQFLAKLSGSIHSFAASRLAAPLYDSLEDARTVLSQNITKLVRLEQVRRKNEAISALRLAAASGDVDTENELLLQQFNQAQQRHGVGER